LFQINALLRDAYRKGFDAPRRSAKAGR